jgi:hypothetical protein
VNNHCHCVLFESLSVEVEGEGETIGWGETHQSCEWWDIFRCSFRSILRCGTMDQPSHFSKQLSGFGVSQYHFLPSHRSARLNQVPSRCIRIWIAGGSVPPLPCARRGRARLFSLPSSSHLLTWDRPIISSVVRQPSTSAWSTAQLRTNRKLLVPVLKGKPLTPVIRIQLLLSRFSFFEKMENIQYRTSELLQTQAYP